MANLSPACLDFNSPTAHCRPHFDLCSLRLCCRASHIQHVGQSLGPAMHILRRVSREIPPQTNQEAIMSRPKTFLRMTALTFALASVPAVYAQREKPLPHPVGAPQSAAPQASVIAAAAAAGWSPLRNQPTFLLDGASNPILLTDGSILVQDLG